MPSTTILPASPPRRVLASGLFGAFVAERQGQPAIVANEQAQRGFTDDYIAGTHTHPLRDVGSEPR